MRLEKWGKKASWIPTESFLPVFLQGIKRCLKNHQLIRPSLGRAGHIVYWYTGFTWREQLLATYLNFDLCISEEQWAASWTGTQAQDCVDLRLACSAPSLCHWPDLYHLPGSGAVFFKGIRDIFSAGQQHWILVSLKRFLPAVAGRWSKVLPPPLRTSSCRLTLRSPR